MAVPPQLVQFAFASGIDESLQGEVLDPTAGFAELQNVRQNKVGALEKRLGYAPIGKTRFDATTRSAGNRLGCHRNVIWTIDGTHLDSFVEAAAASAVTTRVPEVSTTARPLSGSAEQPLGSAVCGDYIATIGIDAYDAIVSVETLAGAVVRAPEVVFTGSAAAPNGVVVAYSTYLVLVLTDWTTANVKAWYLNTATAASITTGWVSIGNVATDQSTTASVAISVQALTAAVAFAYVNDSGGASRATVKLMTIAGVTGTATINTSSTRPVAVCVEGSATDTLWVAWNEAANVKVRGFSPTNLGTTLATASTVGTATTAVSSIFLLSKSAAGTGILAFNDTSGDLQMRAWITSGGAVATSGAQSSVYGVGMLAQPFRRDDRFYSLFGFWGRYSGDSDESVFLCDWTDTVTPATAWLRPVSQTAPFLTTTHSTQARPMTLSATKHAYTAAVKLSSFGGGAFLFSFDFADRKRWRCAAHNGSLYFAGGVLSYFDGRRVAEASYLHRPRKPTATDSGAGTGPTGTFRYVATYEEMDDDGNWCVSGVSDPSTITGTVTNKTITVKAPPLVITGRLLPGATGAAAPDKKRVRVCFYRTKTGGEAPYYFVGYKENDPTAEVSFSDSSTDTTIATKRLLYGTGNLPGTNGSALDRRAPPFCQDVASYNGMLVVASGSTLWWSGQTIDGEGVWFSPAFTVPVDGDGDITALAVQDGTIYAFKRHGIWASAGEAPSDNGAVGGLGTPRRLAVDVGCIDPCSVVVTSLGVFFQSARGLELLGRGGAVQWVGAQVQATLEAFPVVSSAVLDQRNGLVRFSLAASESGGLVSGDGRDVVFDLATQQWQSVDDKKGSASHQPSQDAATVYYGGSYRYAWLGAAGTVYVERDASDGSAHLDGSTWVTMRAKTGWLKMGGIQGKHHVNKVLLLARKSSRADLSTSLGYDYATTTKTAMVRAANDLDALSTAIDRVQLEHHLHDEAEGQSVQVTIEDATPTGGTVGNGKGLTWIAVTFEGTPRQGAVGLPETGM